MCIFEGLEKTSLNAFAQLRIQRLQVRILLGAHKIQRKVNRLQSNQFWRAPLHDPDWGYGAMGTLLTNVT